MKRTWCRERADGIEMRLRVHPGTHSNQVVGPYGDRLKLSIASPPIGDKANEAPIFSWRLNSPPPDRKSRSSRRSRAGRRSAACPPITLNPNGAARTWWIQIVIL